MISDQLTKDELSASSREEFVLASKIHRAPHSLMNANCEPEVGEDEDEERGSAGKDENMDEDWDKNRLLICSCREVGHYVAPRRKRPGGQEQGQGKIGA